MKPTKEQLDRVGLDRMATKLELEAALQTFEAACYRDDSRARMVAGQAAETAFVRHVAAIAANIDLAKRSVGL